MKTRFGVKVSLTRVKEVLGQVDPDGAIFRKARRLTRRVYSVPGAMYFWHQDGYHKLVRWGFILHGCIDGHSRFIVYMQVRASNTKATVGAIFLKVRVFF